MKSPQRIIPAVRCEDDLEAAISSNARMVFLLSGDICSLAPCCEALHGAGKQVMLHIDLVDGLKGDESGIRYAVREFRLAGIISTRPNCLKIAREVGVLGVLRVFVIDSSALRTGESHIQACSPAFVEVLPGVSRKIVRLAASQFRTAVIAGGLISDENDVRTALDAGASAVSTSNHELWKLI